MKFVGNLKWILNRILGIFGKNFENFWENFALIIVKLIPFQCNLLKFWVDIKILSRYQENFLEIRKTANAKRIEKIFRKFFHAFFKYQKYCSGGIDTIESVKISILSNWYRYFCHHYLKHSVFASVGWQWNKS